MLQSIDMFVFYKKEILFVCVILKVSIGGDVRGGINVKSKIYGIYYLP